MQRTNTRFTTNRSYALATFCTLGLLLTSACGDDDDAAIADASTSDGHSGSHAAGSNAAGSHAAGSHAPSDRDAAIEHDAAAANGADAGMCADGCECSKGEVCDFSCSDAACEVMCLGGQCTADCKAGGCTLDADLEAKATYSCSGGGCHMDCDLGSSCALDCEGGGCAVTCDQDSVCTLRCGPGEPCTVTCENGGRGICEGDNCMAENCDTVCEPDPTYQPEIDPNDFTTVIDNPLLPWPIGAVFVSEGEGEVITVTVMDETKLIHGVQTLVVHDEARSPEGELLEDTLDYYAQDSAGNVWYFGEDTAEYLHGEVATTAGSWLYGTDGALPGIVMKAAPKVGDVYRQEYYACEAEDMGEVVELGVSVSGPTGDYDDCVTIRDYAPLEPSANELKTYCPAVGVVQVVDVAEGGIVSEQLTSVTLP